MGIHGFARNEEALAGERARLEREAVRFGNNAPMLYLRSGSTMVRILEAWNDAGQFFKQIYKHRVRTGDQTFEGLCPLTMLNTTCPICEKQAELYDSQNEAVLETAKQLKPRGAYLYNVLCWSGPANKKGQMPEFGKVYVMESGVMVHRQLIELDQDEGAGWADITNITNGVTVIVKRTGQGLDTKYDVNPTLIDGQPRSNILEALAARGIDSNTLELNNLDEVYAMPDNETLAEVVAKVRVPTGTTVAAPAFATASQPAVVAAPSVVVPVAPVVAPVAVPVTPVAVPAPGTVAPVPTTVAPVAAPIIPEPPKTS